MQHQNQAFLPFKNKTIWIISYKNADEIQQKNSDLIQSAFSDGKLFCMKIFDQVC